MESVSDSLPVGEIDESGFFLVVKTDCDKTSTSTRPIPPKFEKSRDKKQLELRLWISHLLRIKPNIDPSTKIITFYKFNNQLVNVVNIYGVVSGVITSRFGISYSIDDGTGEIDCWHDNRNIQKSEGLDRRLDEVMDLVLARKHDESLSSEASSSTLDVANWLREEALKNTKSLKQKFTLGDTVNVRGKLSEFRGERCIRVYNMRHVTNIIEEINRRYELIHQYEKFYSHEDS